MTGPRPSVLAVTSELPWPLDTGGHLRSFHLLTGLAAAFDVRLVAGVRGDGREGVEALQRAGVRVEAVPLRPDTAAGRAVAVVSAALRREPYVLYRRHDRPEMRAALAREVRRQPPDVLYLDHLDSAVFAGLAGRAVVVADLHNIYSLLADRAGLEHGRRAQRIYLRREARLLRRREQALARRADLLFAVSAEECAYFRDAGPAEVRLVPNGVDCAAYRSLPAGRAGVEPVVLYLGTMSWAPNAAAARFLADEVLPRVRARVPGARLRIVGKNPPPDLQARHGAGGVEVTGGVPDVQPYLRDAAVLAVPLEAGGGTRLKILEAFAAGLPVVSTAVGAEGIVAVHGAHLEIARRDQFAGRIVDLLAAPDRGARLARDARDVVDRLYDWPVVAARAVEAIQQAVGEPRRAAPGPQPLVLLPS